MRKLFPVVVALLLGAPAAWGSGAPGPTGPMVIDPDDSSGRFFIGSGFSSFKSTIEFEGQDWEFEQQAIAVTVGKQLGRSWSLTLNVGLVLGGELEELFGDMRREFDIDQGVMANLQLIRQFDFGAEKEWFVAGELAGGFGIANSALEVDGDEIDKERVHGFDARVGVMAGRRFVQVLRPFVAARGFIGPINWTIDGDKETGTDENYYQVAAGLNVDVPLGFSIGFEGAFLGELRLAVGIVSKL